MADLGTEKNNALKKPLISAKARSVIAQIFKQIICIGMVVMVILPILLMVFASFKTKGDMVNTSPLLLPEHITLENYKKVLTDKYLLIGFANTGILLVVIFPLLAPATATVTIIKAIIIINDMYIPYLYMPGNKTQTLTTFLMNYASAQQGSWQTLAAGIVVIMLPTILLYIFFQKYILAGVTAGAVKE